MSTRVVLRVNRLRPRSSALPSAARSFFSKPQAVSTSRTLPYEHTRLYDIIADVDSYSKFVPYCVESRVISWAPRDPSSGRKWPTQATLRVGWGGFEETFTSRLRCAPDQGGLEAVSGPGSASSSSGSVFKSLRTRWTVRPLSRVVGNPASEVKLGVEFEFTNPVYSAVSSAVSDRVVALMIQAFEEHADRVLRREDVGRLS